MNTEKLLKQLPTIEVTLETSQTENEEAWLEQRKKGIGGSEIGAIMGINKWTCAREIYLRKTGQWEEEELSEFKQNLFHFGHVLESVVADEYTLRTGTKLYDPGKSFRSKAEPWKLANVDRLILDEEDNIVGIFEAKTTSEYGATDWLNGDVPEYYLAQLNWYLHVMNLNYGVIACLIGGNKYVYYEFFRNDDWLNVTILPAVDKFWNYHVASMIEPELDGSEAAEELLKKMYKAGDAKKAMVELPDEIDELALELRDLKMSLKTMEKRKTLIENRIKDKMGDNIEAVTASAKFTWKPQTRVGLDQTRIKVERPDLFEQYKKVSEFKKFGFTVDDEE